VSLRSRALIVLILAAGGLLTEGHTAPAVGQLIPANPVDIAPSEGINDFTRTFSATVEDYDRDGFQDALVIRHYPELNPDIPQPRLWHNEENLTPPPPRAFADKGAAFTKTDRHHCTWGDADVDGDLDLFCAVGLGKYSENELWLQKPDHTFTGNVANGWGLQQDTNGRFRMATFIDANGDPYPDIYVTRWASYGAAVPDPYEPYPNNLWINVPSTTTSSGRGYVHAPELGLDEPIGSQKDTPSCAQAVDYDRDGDEDLLACGQKTMLLYRNNRIESPQSPAFTRQIDFGFWKDAELADLDGDLNPDLVQVRPKIVQIRFSNGTGGFASASASNQWTFANAGENVAVGDFNRDGLDDVYVLRKCPGKRPEATDGYDLLLMNEGNRTFSSQQIAGVDQGCGDDVQPIDYDNDGDYEWLVTNGNRLREGPVQLLENQPIAVP
jgi:FG-GAP-like repeat